jgi:hypothetical protein
MKIVGFRWYKSEITPLNAEQMKERLTMATEIEVIRAMFDAKQDRQSRENSDLSSLCDKLSVAVNESNAFIAKHTNNVVIPQSVNVK